MALLDAGHFQTTHFPSSHWQTSPQRFPEYGAAATGGDSARYYYFDRLPKRDNKQLLETLKALLQSIRDD
jgi:hypothetical protein